MMAGQVIGGRYELSRRLGVGGMSTVHLAFDRRLEREVAVKLLAEHLAEDSQFVTRFRREALSVARLVHPNIVQVFDFGVDEATGSHFIVMEFVPGQSGAELLREHGSLPVPDTLSIVTQACRGLDYAHRSGVVHRDVKPGNLLRADDGTVKLADFGIAKAMSEQSSITQVGSVLGTAAYLAPEQAHGEPAGPPADIYALGVVTYQLLSGRLPYDASSLTELALKQQSEVPTRLDHVVPGVTPELAGAVERALALDARDRFASAEELREALVDGARGIGSAPTAATALAAGMTSATRVVGGTRARAPRAAPAAVEPATATGAAPVRRVPREAEPPAAYDDRPPRAPARERQTRRRGLARLLVLLLVLAALLGGGAAYLATSSDQQAVRLRRVTYDNVQQSVDAMKQLVDDNTR
jgi:eukaryotic-like serine/threonine-protein kinase